ncbi:Predicted enzyme related to lactoylglutathione lyase [Kytococcus sedentarius]|uniref:Glyoxalase-like domain-containing protein n=2 Tax=Kytococcus sedentarius TaxID=1276 RepID=C7NJF4_KYTSD|nr:hypothetical protein Ksed_01980 [Kytococcus sedentarius DSM 20547]STX13308.1 Predicted enzyme related to lactoylglutathione lyase [Kytococcus sedentarius]
MPQLGQDGIFGIGPLEAGEEALWVQYTLVPQLDPVLARARELGAGQVGEVMDLGFGRSAHLTTPAGAAFGLFEGSEEMREQMEQG